MDLTYDRNVRLNKLINDYKDTAAYLKSSAPMDYMQFDYAVSHDLTLFRIDPDLDFEELEKRTDAILNVLPSIKRIFAQPLIHLKEQDVILPVDAVRIVNNDTLTHIASHSELWSDVQDDAIKPEKLLSRTYDDNYGIYENKVFCNVVDDILAFARSNLKFLQEFVYTNKTIEINLLERVNHLNYFLALGKLHIGYSRSFEKYYAVSERCLNKLQYISNCLVSRLKRPVYKNNKNRPANIKIRKTNILSMHKEYHQVYKFAKSFSRGNAAQTKKVTNKAYNELCKVYEFFCRALCIFAIGHFNFTCDEKKVRDMTKARLDFAFRDWTINLDSIVVADRRVITLEICKDKPYTVVLIPSVEEDNKDIVAAVKAGVRAYEYIVCTPNEERESGEMLVDISSIESFRRLQQVILRGMIYADKKRTDCPFCNNSLAVNEEKSVDGRVVRECVSCRTEIHEQICKDTGKPYFSTRIADFTAQVFDNDRSWLAQRSAEGKMYFRNITDMDEDMKPVCPHCGNVH